jgi:hypothetical protein
MSWRKVRDTPMALTAFQNQTTRRGVVASVGSMFVQGRAMKGVAMSTNGKGLERLRTVMRKTRKWLLVGLGVWVTLVLIVGFTTRTGFEPLGQLGDSLAPLAVMAAAAALFVSAYSLLLQREDIDQQIAEMRHSVEAQRDLGKLQAEDLRMRKWEQVLRACNQLREDIDTAIKVRRSPMQSPTEPERDSRPRQSFPRPCLGQPDVGGALALLANSA